jgi:hypothetical protein
MVIENIFHAYKVNDSINLAVLEPDVSVADPVVRVKFEAVLCQRSHELFPAHVLFERSLDVLFLFPDSFLLKIRQIVLLAHGQSLFHERYPALAVAQKMLCAHVRR